MNPERENVWMIACGPQDICERARRIVAHVERRSYYRASFLILFVALRWRLWGLPLNPRALGRASRQLRRAWFVLYDRELRRRRGKDDSVRLLK